MHITKRMSSRQSEPLTLMSILCIHITVSEYIVINLYCHICNPQNRIAGDQRLSLTDADDLLSVYGLHFENSPAENMGHDAYKIRMLPLSPSLFPVLSLEGLGAGYHRAPFRARPASGSVAMATERKSRCST